MSNTGHAITGACRELSEGEIESDDDVHLEENAAPIEHSNEELDDKKHDSRRRRDRDLTSDDRERHETGRIRERENSTRYCSRDRVKRDKDEFRHRSERSSHRDRSSTNREGRSDRAISRRDESDHHRSRHKSHDDRHHRMHSEATTQRSQRHDRAPVRRDREHRGSERRQDASDERRENRICREKDQESRRSRGRSRSTAEPKESLDVRRSAVEAIDSESSIQPSASQKSEAHGNCSDSSQLSQTQRLPHGGRQMRLQHLAAPEGPQRHDRSPVRRDHDHRNSERPRDTSDHHRGNKARHEKDQDPRRSRDRSKSTVEPNESLDVRKAAFEATDSESSVQTGLSQKSEARGSCSESSQMSQTQRLPHGGPLTLEDRQKLLQRVADPEGPRNVQKRVRERTLAAICVEGQQPLTKVKRIPEDPIMKRIAGYIRNKTIVTIRLRKGNHFEPPNRTVIGRILSADKHWNLLVTDADEAYVPARRLGICQVYADQMFHGTAYDRPAKGERVLQRTLESTIIMGSCIVYIAALETA